MHETTRTIIVAADREDRGRDALALAVTLALWRDARLLLVGVCVSPLGPGDGLYERAMRDAAARELGLLRAEASQDLEVATRVVGSTSVVRGLHAVADEVGADVLVLGSSHLGRAGRALRGDVALAAIHAAPAPVAIAPAGYAAAAPPAGAPVIDVAYDGSPESEQALRAAADLARSAGGRVHIVSILDFPYIYVDPPLLDESGRKSYLRSLKSDVRDRLDSAARNIPANLQVTTELAEGIASVELVRAGAAADLMVMGSRAYGPMKRVLAGSVAAGVVERAQCPVLVLPRGWPVDAGSTVESTLAAT
jgi:nucleotide-binding universal stress UspA family protein